jgi:arsenate reductase
MKLSELKHQLAAHPDLNIRFHLPNGIPIPAHAHVTEVALIEKKFIDCGGTFRTQSTCRLQTWVADDLDHRLTSGTLLKILNKAASFLKTDDLDADIEHELDYVTQFPLETTEPGTNELVLRLAERHTDCLAKEKCCPPPSPLMMPNPPKFQFHQKESEAMAKKNVLFVCIHNSARSQMAEAFLNRMCAEQFEAYSAGIEPGKLNPIVVEAMQEIGIDISRNQTKSVDAMLNSGNKFDHVITVCDETSAERCPFVPGLISRLHWGFPDPSALQGSHADKLARTREIRDMIKAKVEELCAEVCPCVPA